MPDENANDATCPTCPVELVGYELHLGQCVACRVVEAREYVFSAEDHIEATGLRFVQDLHRTKETA